MNSENQEEELEVLRSIYEGDANFKEMNIKTFQYKVTFSYNMWKNLNIGSQVQKQENMRNNVALHTAIDTSV